MAGRALNGLGTEKYHVQSNSELPSAHFGSQSDPAKRAGLKGNNPDYRLRPLNECSVLNDVEFLRQPGGWLRSSHPLKKA
jgi:hypothetical protein